MFGIPLTEEQLFGDGNWWDTVTDWVDGFVDFWQALSGPDQQYQYQQPPPWGYPGAPSMPFDWTSMMPLFVIGGIFLVIVTFIGRK